ncbi:cytochrome C [Kiloniella spongiae]|uniref:Cytochrome C n=2 Tax=Kiloniella spongiae TaxID=1489064 RepID=A0A0H2MAW1_9PROT|nr:cytochrome C [Kiloniella spongiae]
MGLAIASSLYTGQASAGDAVAGKKVFNKCKACHTIGKNKIGPDLAGLFGRPAASVEGYKYSKAMKASGITWTEDNLAKFLKKPKAFVPKTKMGFGGLKKEKQIEDLLAYLKEVTAQ